MTGDAPSTLPDPGVLSDEGLAVVAGIVENMRAVWASSDTAAPSDASAWLVGAAEALVARLAPEMRRRIDARMTAGLDELLDEGSS